MKNQILSQYFLPSVCAILLCCTTDLRAELVGGGGSDSVDLTGVEAGTMNGTPFSGVSLIDTAGGQDFATTNASVTLSGFSAFLSNGVTVVNVENVDTTQGTVFGTGSNDDLTLGSASNDLVGPGFNITGANNVDFGLGSDVLWGNSTDNTFTVSGSNSLTANGITFTNYNTVNGSVGSNTLDFSLTGTTSIVQTFQGFSVANVISGNLNLSGNLTASDVFVTSGAGISGVGSITGNLELLAGSGLLFKPGETLSVSGSVALDASFGVDDLLGLDNTIAEGIYTLIDETSTDFSLLGIENFGEENAFDLGEGKFAYFADGSLQLVVVPEPSAYALILGLFATIHLMRRRSLRVI